MATGTYLDHFLSFLFVYIGNVKTGIRILLLEPYHGGSHRLWAEGLKKHSKHHVEIFKLPPRHWKWRMHGAAITFANEFKKLTWKPDLILATDMLDLATFNGITPDAAHIPAILYFHENQITYPWSKNDEDKQLNRDNHYGFVNYTAALTADKVLFNSEYHRSSFLGALPEFLRSFPDHLNLHTVQEITDKSEVLHLGMNLTELDELKPNEIARPDRATILWNHRWEYDKNPEQFFRVLIEIQERGWEFNLIVLGEQFKNAPSIFKEAREILKDRIIHWGYAETQQEYVKWLWHADILLVTSNQDFFGGSVVEAMYCNVKPLLPKRLSYPEHIPAFLHHVFFYEEEELTDKLQRWIKDVSVLRKQQTRSFVEKYDWSVLSGHYDEVLADLV